MQSASEQVKASPAPMVEQAGEVERVTKAAQAAEARYAEMYPEHADRIENIISAYTFDTPADRCRAHEVARAMGGHPRLNTRPAPAETEGVRRDEIARIIEPAAFEPETVSNNRIWRNDSFADGRRIALEKADRIFAALSTPPTPPADAGMLREALADALGSELSGAYDCGRVWEAWSVGTMGEDDFSPVSDRIDEIVDTVVDVIGARHTALITALEEIGRNPHAGIANNGYRSCREIARAALNSQAHQIREGEAS